MATQTPVFIVEMYTPSEIVEARRPFRAETATDALRAAMGWINEGGQDATNVRIVDTAGLIMFDQPVANLKECPESHKGQKLDGDRRAERSSGGLS